MNFREHDVVAVILAAGGDPKNEDVRENTIMFMDVAAQNAIQDALETKAAGLLDGLGGILQGMFTKQESAPADLPMKEWPTEAGEWPPGGNDSTGGMPT